MSKRNNGRSTRSGNGKPPFANPNTLEQELRRTEGACEIFAADPSRVARAWATAQMSGVNRQLCTSLIESALAKLDNSTLQQFVTAHLICEERYGGIWPKCFFEQVGVTGILAVTRSSDRCEGATGAYLETAKRLFSENLNWSEILSPSCDPDSMCDVASSLMGICVTMGHFPLPTSDKQEVRGIIFGNQHLEPFSRNGERIVSVNCWIGKTDLTVVDWVVGRSEKAFEIALGFTSELVGELRPDHRYLEVISATRHNHRQILDRIETFWSDIRRVKNGDCVYGFRRWVMGGGLTQLCVEIENKGFRQTLGPITLIPNTFPQIEVEIPWRPCLGIPMIVIEKDTLDPQSGILQDCFTTVNPDSDEWYLKLRISLAIVEVLHRLAFAPVYCSDQTRERNGSSNGHVGRAVLPHFRRLATRRKSGKMDEPSTDAVNRALDMVGMEPPDGYTFAATPPIVCRKHNPTLKPIELRATISI